MEKDILNKEQEHLTKTYNKLLEMKNKLQEQIDSLNEKAVDDKNDIRDNIRFDYADIETTMETLAEIEVGTGILIHIMSRAIHLERGLRQSTNFSNRPILPRSASNLTHQRSLRTTI